MGLRSFFGALLRPLGLEVVRISSYDTDNYLMQTTLKYKKVAVSKIAENLGYKVQRGPFENMILPTYGAWSDYDLASKLVGSYEAELFPAIADLAKVPFATVVNIGASEGYYAIGLKRMLPEAAVYTYDIDKSSVPALEACQRLNETSVTRLDKFDFADPFAEDNSGQNLPCLFVIDCEGCETQVINIPKEILKKSHFLIELHDLFVPGVTKLLVDFLAETHDVEVIPQSPRNSSEFPELQGFSDLQKAIILDEYRGDKMDWLHATPRS